MPFKAKCNKITLTNDDNDPTIQSYRVSFNKRRSLRLPDDGALNCTAIRTLERHALFVGHGYMPRIKHHWQPGMKVFRQAGFYLFCIPG